ncbi:putative uncharacterized protein DDB_G0282133 isoform X1 [Panonychus citri]|nr:putative uncharacterized protein DDB_G0282133 isoform X1 [Panonychus citri]XP_053204158.1 putative uncharacterized protein DDB_G0282133 isoform X1 [Panonychus citri]XP_053204159.1 putative uncharacterized protein DDB_G0282133 isoform X1 [Panonychus citri]XP_053213195.1 putative uncharacterized protein DDB_G0282133 isoform X1 [Panonychus citri]XP_053213196.1 putative uncharacterized protein DDB_G0282133 isoform X1 [Panonychus citri]XP_053213197.1 putative uncharacterized protein DDB_G0282133
MFSYYALETWLFSFFALLLLGFIIFYTKRLITILTDMRKSNKKVSYKPWEMEKKVAKGKVKVPRRFGPIKGLVPVRESAITTKKSKQLKSLPSNRLDSVDGIATIEGALSRSSSVGSGISYETTTTNSEFYRESRLSVSEMVKEEGSWISQLMVDQNQNSVKNNLQAHISAAAVENLSANLPKTVANGNTVNHENNNSTTVTANGKVKTIHDDTINRNTKNKETKEDDNNNNNNNNYKEKITNGGVILVTPEINNLPFSNTHKYYSPSNQQSIRDSKLTLPMEQNDDHIEVISKTIPVLDESFTSSSTTIEGNNRSTITKTTSKKVIVTEVSKQRKLENRIAA